MGSIQVSTGARKRRDFSKFGEIVKASVFFIREFESMDLIFKNTLEMGFLNFFLSYLYFYGKLFMLSKLSSTLA